MDGEITKKEAVEFLGVPEKNFNNYFKNSKEIHGFKKRNRWFFKKSELKRWKKLKDERTVTLSMKEYEACFEFAIKMAYAGRGGYGTGIRGTRSEVQVADDFILGILAELGFKKFLRKKFGKKIKLDMDIHFGQIVEQDIDKVWDNSRWRDPKIKVAVKSSKVKSCFNIIPPLEYENKNRKSDFYIFARVDLSTDHLFRILREHSFFKKAKEDLEKDERFRKISKLKNVKIWICGFVKHKNFKKVTEIPGLRNFGEKKNYRYVKSVADMKNSDEDWEKFIDRL